MSRPLAWLAGIILSAVCLALFVAAALAADNGQWKNAPDSVRQWFRSVKSPRGVPCCDIADGYRADWDIHAGAYRVRIEGEWFDVPPEAVVDSSGNPTGDAVVWFTTYSGSVFIRCFVPGNGT